MGSLLKFYAWYVTVAIGLAGLIAKRDTQVFAGRPVLWGAAAAGAFPLPALVGLAFHKWGSLRKVARVAGLPRLRARVFGTVSLLMVLAATSLFFVEAIRKRVSDRMLAINLLAVDFVVIYILAMLISGRISSKDVPDLLIQRREASEVYVYKHRQLHHIPDPSTLLMLGYSFTDVTKVDDDEFKAYRVGPPIESVFEAKLVKAIDHPAVWIVIGGVRRWVPDPITLQYCMKDTPRAVAKMPSERVNQWKEGPPLVSTLGLSRLSEQGCRSEHALRLPNGGWLSRLDPTWLKELRRRTGIYTVARRDEARGSIRRLGSRLKHYGEIS